MTSPEVTKIRTDLGLTQVQFGQLLGVHPLTVSKWERGLLDPAPHQQALINSFQRAKAAQAAVGKEAQTLLATAGVALALFILLRAAFGEGPQPKT